SNEKQQVGLAIERAIAIKDDPQRAAVFRVLKAMWPQYSQIALAEQTQSLLQVPIQPVGAQEQCFKARAAVAELEEARQKLQSAIRAEAFGTPGLGSGQRGFGPIAKALTEQLRDVEVKIARAKAENAGCLI